MRYTLNDIYSVGLIFVHLLTVIDTCLVYFRENVHNYIKFQMKALHHGANLNFTQRKKYFIIAISCVAITMTLLLVFTYYVLYTSYEDPLTVTLNWCSSVVIINSNLAIASIYYYLLWNIKIRFTELNDYLKLDRSDYADRNFSWAV